MNNPAHTKCQQYRPVLLVATVNRAVLNEANREKQKHILKLDNNGIDLSQIDMVVVRPENLQEAIAAFYGSVAGVIIDAVSACKVLADSMDVLGEGVRFSLTSNACGSNAKPVKDKMLSICGDRFVPQWSSKLTRNAVSSKMADA